MLVRSPIRFPRTLVPVLLRRALHCAWLGLCVRVAATGYTPNCEQSLRWHHLKLSCMAEKALQSLPTCSASRITFNSRQLRRSSRWLAAVTLAPPQPCLLINPAAQHLYFWLRAAVLLSADGKCITTGALLRTRLCRAGFWHTHRFLCECSASLPYRCPISSSFCLVLCPIQLAAAVLVLCVCRLSVVSS